MPKFRKIPAVIEAVQWTGYNKQEMSDFIGEPIFINPISGTFDIKTLEGVMEVVPGAWIIKGVKGEFYPCKPDIFFYTYEEVVEG